MTTIEYDHIEWTKQPGSKVWECLFMLEEEIVAFDTFTIDDFRRMTPESIVCRAVTRNSEQGVHLVRRRAGGPCKP